jgi:hypothetical protein
MNKKPKPNLNRLRLKENDMARVSPAQYMEAVKRIEHAASIHGLKILDGSMSPSDCRKEAATLDTLHDSLPTYDDLRYTLSRWRRGWREIAEDMETIHDFDHQHAPAYA